MINREELNRLISNKQKIYIRNRLDITELELDETYSTVIYSKNEYLVKNNAGTFEGFWNLETLYTDKKDAEWDRKFTTYRKKRFRLPKYKDFNENTMIIPFTGTDDKIYIMKAYKDKICINLAECKITNEIFLETFENTEGEYENACKLVMNIFKGCTKN